MLLNNGFSIQLSLPFSCRRAREDLVAVSVVDKTVLKEKGKRERERTSDRLKECLSNSEAYSSETVLALPEGNGGLPA